MKESDAPFTFVHRLTPNALRRRFLGLLSCASVGVAAKTLAPTALP